MFHKCFKSVSKVLWEWFQSVCQSQCFKVVCSHWSHRSYPSIRRACFSWNNFWPKLIFVLKKIRSKEIFVQKIETRKIWSKCSFFSDQRWKDKMNNEMTNSLNLNSDITSILIGISPTLAGPKLKSHFIWQHDMLKSICIFDHCNRFLDPQNLHIDTLKA